MRGKWKCPHCDQICSRHWNLKTHIRRKHLGVGVPVKVDYESTTSDPQIFHEDGLYPLNPLTLRERHQSYFAGIGTRDSKVPDVFDNVRGYLLKVKDLKQKLAQNVELFREIYSNSIIYPTPPVALSSYQDLRHESLSAPASYLEGNDKIPPIYDSSQDPLRNKIVGFKGYECTVCTSCCVIAIYYFVDLGTVYSNEHKCEPAHLEECKTVPASTNRKFLQYQQRLLSNKLIQEYVKWAGNPLLLASQKIEGTIEGLTKKSLTLLKTTSETHWLLRAIREQSTALTQEELRQFLFLSENNNINSFEILFAEREELSGTFCIQVSKKFIAQSCACDM